MKPHIRAVCLTYLYNPFSSATTVLYILFMQLINFPISRCTVSMVHLYTLFLCIKHEILIIGVQDVFVMCVSAHDSPSLKQDNREPSSFS